MRRLDRITRRTERMLLRPFQESDAQEFARLIEVSREVWAPWTPASERVVSGRELFSRELKRADVGAGSGTHLRLAGFVENEERLVGIFALNEIVRGVFQSAHASWQIGADRMGQGLGTEGVRALLDIAFDEPPRGIGLHRVQANIMPANAPSLRIAEKVGFRREGLAQRYLKIAGRWEDHAMFAITAEEWWSTAG